MSACYDKGILSVSKLLPSRRKTRYGEVGFRRASLLSPDTNGGGIKANQGCWRTRYNFELYRLYKKPQVIRNNRLRWLGHIWRSPENNQTRAYTFKNTMGSRTRGRPPTRWIDVENDLKTLNIKNWQSCCVSLELEEASCGGSQDP
ncbi:endonuclease-reverse transcriptase [Trichonephila clavipes]|nr:endonuclease-reverse transcriptase [Trichonephila clavipes]